MKKQLKRLLAALLPALAAVCAPAATPTYNTLCINRADGVTEHLQLHKDLHIGLSPEGNIRLSHPTVTVEIAREDVKTFTVIDDKSFTEVYDGTHQSGIVETASPECKVTISATEITVTGTDGIALYDIKGAKVGSTPAEDGRATLGISSLPKGVYILKSGKTTLKIII